MPKQLCRWTQPGHPSVDGHGKYQLRWRLRRKTVQYASPTDLTA